MKFLTTLILALLIGFVSWPYYHVYKLDTVLGTEELARLAPLVDLEQVQKNMRSRFDRHINRAGGGQQDKDSLIGWLQDNARELTGMAVDEAITLEWVRDVLREAARSHSSQNPPYFMSAIDFAFFESPDTFFIRLGDLGEAPVWVRMKLVVGRWVVTDIID